MSAVVLLDAGPLGLLSNPHNPPPTTACRNWATQLEAAGRRLIIPEITDYEVRRELLRANKPVSITLLDALARQLEYRPLTTAAIRRAAALWAQARQQGQPTAGDNTIDADMILAAQALTLGVAPLVIATTNLGHLSRFVPADLWQNISP